ncbi:ATP-binding protein [Bacillus luteolus]|uniref:histidine kinase n=1 Tax=Litchfieldia luteola TaxID=682179 RepID=A0ABR9QJ00_9BACI|nr:ATP-binding protein [Cytobacillus luteolus]MBE4908478.1 ATP-binding protein [Cytobacillus luteolus]MBP1941330.1 two-component system sporulation sensor kinase B [Cytobacillus luteolus]
MVTIFKDFILNIFFIFSPLIFYPYIYKIKHRVFLYRFLLTILFSVILIIVMTLPINVNGLTYDFRSIAVIVGSLYGGPVVSVVLFGVLIIYRFILGNANTFLYAISLIPTIFIVFLTLKRFNSIKIYQKIIMAVVLCTLMKILTFSLYLSFIGQLDLLISSLRETLQTYIVQGIIIGFCVYLLEKLNHYYYMEEEIYRSEKLKMVSEMAASVAHEIRNPLTTVKGFIQLFAEDHLDKSKKEEFKQICLEELNRADLIISDYLSLAKPTIDVVENIDLQEEVRYLSNVLFTYASFNNIEIKTSSPDESDMYIVGDRNKLRQALINLCKNGIEAMQEGGILEIELKKLGKTNTIYIRDNGQGMSPQQLKRLGTPFYSSKEKGTGLGTMVSYAIIKKMDGEIEIDSEVGKGTKYVLTFPEKEIVGPIN